jgi:Arm DNA-binding domain
MHANSTADTMAGQIVVEECEVGKKVSRNAQRLLTVREFLNARDGDHSDGGGVYLRVRGESAIWFFRYTADSGKRREMGLGPASRGTAEAASESLTEARDAAEKARKVLAAGKDPIDMRKAAKGLKRASSAVKKAVAKVEALTLARASRQYHERFIEPHRSDKHGMQWIASLENHIPDDLWNKPIANVTAGELLDVLLDLFATIGDLTAMLRTVATDAPGPTRPTGSQRE